MATYHQYSEIVAAYGYKLPPPPRPQGSRIALPLVYAAVGVALGTFAGTALAVASLAPGTIPGSLLMSNHLTFASSHSSANKIHALANSGQSPVIQNHSLNQIVLSAPAPAIADHSVNLTAKALQPPVIQTPATSQIAKVAEAPAIQHRLLKLSFTAPPPAPLKVASVEPVHAKTPLVAAVVKQAAAPAVHAQISTLKITAAPASVTKPAPTQLASTPALPNPPPPAATMSLDGGFKPLVFYSEGDATVVDYNAVSGTIETDDGRSFQIGATVSASNAVPWGDYHANVHYRCDQNGNCTLIRTGVVALNARLI
jgi:hypothetical protein